MRRGRTRGVDHCCFHVTHRCQERRFLLKFEVDRRDYVVRLRDAAREYGVSVLNYVITSNHVHLLLWTDDETGISAMMRSLQGAVGRAFNRRKEREGAFWSDRYHPTLIQNGAHLGRCLFYIDMNMVRAKAVEHPRKWACCGYHELSGSRQRYRVLDRERLLHCLNAPCAFAEFEEWYRLTLEEKLACAYHAREPLWSECVAVGDRDWVERLAGRIPGGRGEIVSHEVPVRMDEAEISYGLKVGSRNERGLVARMVGEKRLERRIGH